MMKKAYRYTDEILFYFDAFDNKYVATGGSLAWRLNNPGLLLSYSLHRTGYSAIGAYHQYAIFSHLIIGKDALRSWICSTKYFDSPLIEIAKYYLPSNPAEYLKQLCAISGFSPKIIPRSLSAKDFDKLLKTIQQLAGFSPENEHQVTLLPKITARFYSIKGKIEFYLAGYEDLLTKNQAIKWVEAHKLDAVIVHKNALISPEASHPESHNYFSAGDLVSRLTSRDPALFLLELHEGTKAGLTVEQVIAQMIQDDADVYMTSQDEKAIKAYWEERKKYYENKLHSLRNVTVLDEHRSGTWEHAFINPIYQDILKKIIHRHQHGEY